MKNSKIKIGDNVRSFDFVGNKDMEGANACYVEGIVESIEGHPLGGRASFYKFKIVRKIFGGIECDQDSEYNWAPVNGQKDLFGREVNQVELID